MSNFEVFFHFCGSKFFIRHSIFKIRSGKFTQVSAYGAQALGMSNEKTISPEMAAQKRAQAKHLRSLHKRPARNRFFHFVRHLSSQSACCTFYSRERIGFMLWKKCLDSSVKFLLTTIILCICTCTGMGQDSKPAAGVDLKAVWKDSATGLTWAVKDNGSSVSPNQASGYCRSLRSGGYSDWRLPTIDELEALYDSKASKPYKVKGPIILSDACVLSGSTNSSGEVWTLCFNSGSRNLGGGTGCGTTGLALCARGPER
jgi:hypothetical protein